MNQCLLTEKILLFLFVNILTERKKVFLMFKEKPSTSSVKVLILKRGLSFMILVFCSLSFGDEQLKQLVQAEMWFPFQVTSSLPGEAAQVVPPCLCLRLQVQACSYKVGALPCGSHASPTSEGWCGLPLEHSKATARGSSWQLQTTESAAPGVGDATKYLIFAFLITC